MLSVYSPAFTSAFSPLYSSSRSPFGFESLFDHDEDDHLFFSPLSKRQRDQKHHNQLQRRGPFLPFTTILDSNSGSNNMKLDIIEQNDGYQVKADLPGVKKEDINVSLNDTTNVLTLSVTKQEEVNHDTDTYKKRERHFGSISRSIHLPENSNLESVECNYQDGVLSLQVPKLAPIEDKRSEIKTIKVN